MYVDKCVWYEGHHVQGAPDCPHNLGHDEMGDIKPRGWTVQSAAIDLVLENHGIHTPGMG